MSESERVCLCPTCGEVGMKQVAEVAIKIIDYELTRQHKIWAQGDGPKRSGAQIERIQARAESAQNSFEKHCRDAQWKFDALDPSKLGKITTKTPKKKKAKNAS